MIRRGAGRLTQAPLVDLFRRESKHSQHFDEYFNYRLCHGGSGLDFRVDHEAPCEVLDAFKDVDKGIIA
jgi:hypothetical protein